MANDLETAAAAAESAAESPPALAFVERLVERAGLAVSARAVFGEAVERDGVTVIPVARVRWGVGGGGGGGTSMEGEKKARGQGSGGGAGGTAGPLGFIELRDGQAQFVRIKDPAAVAPLVVASAVGAWIVLRGFRALFH